MKEGVLRVLMLGDIFGRPGREIVRDYLPKIKREHNPDVIIANGENAAGGFGLTRKIATQLFEMGIDVITSGNHVWDQKEMMAYIQEEPRILRPANYPTGVPGNYLCYVDLGPYLVAVVNLSGRVYMADFDCPFTKMEEILTEVKERTKFIVVDFHAEATSEKIAFAMFIDGKVSIIAGTHTHVPTADYRVLPQGTAYITDLGMCGPLNGVLGVDKDTVIHKFLTQLPVRFSVAKGPSQLWGILVDLDASGKAINIQQINYEKNTL